MRYLTLSADYHGPMIQDGERTLTCEELGIGEELCRKLIEWNEKYKKVISLSMEDRNEFALYIQNLDSEGISLSRSIVKEMKGEVKIKYYSEGRLKYICEV